MMEINNIKEGDYLLGDFIVNKILGGENQSGQGKVFLCTNSMGMEMAFKTFQDKILKLSTENRDKFINNFKKEAVSWGTLKGHSNIISSTVKVFNERPFICMESIMPNKKGQINLKDYLKDDLDEKIILIWAIQFCNAMVYANSKGILVHGDIKPSNLLIDDGILKIADFGSVQLTEDNPFYDFVEKWKYNPVDTVVYRAPEIFNNPNALNFATDIYSFGLVLYQMLNKGKLPFYPDSNDTWESLHKNAEIPSLKSDVFPMVKKCLNKNPDDRYKNFNDLLKDLNNLFTKKFKEEPYSPTIKKVQFDYLENAMVLLELGYYGDAIQMYDNEIVKNPNDNFSRMEWGVELINRNKNYAALKQLLMVEKLNESDALKYPVNKSRLYFNIAHIYQNIGNIKKAIIYYEKSIDLKKNCKMAKINLGNVFMGLNRFDEAKKLYLEVLNINPNYIEALINMGILCNKKGLNNQSEYYFKKVIDLNPSEIIYDYWGVQYAINKDWNNASSKFTEAISINKYYIQAHLDMFQLYLNVDLNYAKEKANEIMENFNNYNVKFNIAQLYADYGYYGEGISIFEDIILNDDSLKIEALMEKANVLQKINQNLAMDCFNEVINQTEDKYLLSEAWNNKGIIYSDSISENIESKKLKNADLKIFDSAIKCFNKSKEFNQENELPDLNIGVIYGKMAFYNNDSTYHLKALEQFNKSLDINPYNPDLWFQKANAHIQLGELNQSWEACNNSLSISFSEKSQELKNILLELKSFKELGICSFTNQLN